MTDTGDRKIDEMVEHLFRNSAGRMVGHLIRHFGAENLELAEEVVQDALLKALQQWPHRGTPANPAGWLLQAARNGAIDALRRNVAFRGKAAVIQERLRAEEGRAPEDPAFHQELRDDELRLILLCCHPILPRDARVALSLKTACGFSVPEIARAFLSNDATIAQRLVRAKQRLRESKVEMDLPDGPELANRLDSVLEVVYLLFNEGYGAHEGEHLVRFELCGEALRLGRLIADCPLTGLPKAHALVALMSFQSGRLPARIDPTGDLVLLEEQDRSLWDHELIALGFHHLERSASGDRLTDYHLQAAIAAVHARAGGSDSAAWAEILELYDQLLRLHPSPIVALNRAVAIAKVHGPMEALKELDRIAVEPALRDYYLLPAVRGEFFAQLGKRELAADSFRIALNLPCSEPERRFLSRKLERCRSS